MTTASTHIDEFLFPMASTTPVPGFAELYERYYEAVPDGVINNRFDWINQTAGTVHCDFVTPEYSTQGDPNRKWESTRGIGTSFGFNREESDATYLSPDELVRMFVDLVAHGGNLLLNVGPTADGTIPWAQARGPRGPSTHPRSRSACPCHSSASPAAALRTRQGGPAFGPSRHPFGPWAGT